MTRNENNFEPNPGGTEQRALAIYTKCQGSTRATLQRPRGHDGAGDQSGSRNEPRKVFNRQSTIDNRQSAIGNSLFRIPHSAFGVLVLVAAAAFTVAQTSPPNASLESRVEIYLATGGHADHVGEDFEPNLVRDLKEAPPELKDRLRANVLDVAAYLKTASGDRSRHRSALRLMALSDEDGRRLAAEQLRTVIREHEVNLPIRPGWNQSEEGRAYESTRRAVYALRVGVLSVLGELRDPQVVEEALELVARAEPATQNDAVRTYLRPLALSPPAVLERLKAVVADPAHPLFGHKALSALITEVQPPRSPDEKP
jgi:hypothetical protein